MSVLLIAGSPSERSRSAALLDAIEQRLEARGTLVERVLIRDLSPQSLVLADVSHPSISQALAKVARARAIVVATPIYKAAYSGVLKLFLDLLPQTAFKGKTVLPLATGGSPHHMLALDYALRPVLQSLSADHILPGVFAIDGQVVLLPSDAHQLDVELAQRLERAVDLLPSSAGWNKVVAPLAGIFEPIDFSRVRCSV
ncbi:NADPH-dependent FMN reductase [Rhodoferax sp.]|uniref:NADPH-dependent FMN reductase n=1 Tax=Rhodoferax sp. TaxID=50421 RepID=UPI00374CB20A